MPASSGSQPGEDVRSGVGDQRCAGRRAPLVAHDVEAVALGRGAENGLQEVLPPGVEDPARAQHQVARGAGDDGLFARQLAAPVDVRRRRRIGFGPGPLAAAVENIIGGVVDQPGAQPGGFGGQHLTGAGIDREGSLRLALGTVDSGVGGRIDDDVRRHCLHGAGQLIRPGQVAAQRGTVAMQGRDLAHHRQAAPQLPAELAVRAEQQDLHAAVARPSYCCATHCR